MVAPPKFKRTLRTDTNERDNAGRNNSNTTNTSLSRWQLHRATRTRETWSVISSVFLALSLIFLIMVEIGSVRNKTAIRDIWFIKLDISNVIPQSVGNVQLLNSIARTLGLHDFYTVGLWNFCEGYNDQGITNCAPTQTLYWFNPVAIIKNELLAGASIQLPQQISYVLNLIRLASKVMFGLFLTGACLTFVLIFIQAVSLYSRWWSFALMVLNFLNAVFITVASVVATAMFVLMQTKLQGQNSVQIEAHIGNTMFALMWIASAFAIFAFVVQLSLLCCCASRRDVRRGKKRGSRKAYEA